MVVTMVAVHMMSCHGILCYTVEWPVHHVYSTGKGGLWWILDKFQLLSWGMCGMNRNCSVSVDE